MSDMVSWTDERVERLKQLWAEGLSASMVAAELGGVTRNAVIGKVHRLGLAGRVKPPIAAAARRAKPAARLPSQPAVIVPAGIMAGATAGQMAGSLPAALAASGLTLTRGNAALAFDRAAPALQAAPEPVLDTRPLHEVVIPFSERVTIMDLREHSCRWPIGDPGRSDFRFCGGRKSPGNPYCGHHVAMAYQPVLDRRRDRRALRA